MTAREKRIAESIKDIVSELRAEVEFGSYVPDNISSLVEDAYSTLNLDYTFINVEQRKLKSFGYRFNADKTEATRKFKGTPVKVEKFGFEQFTLVFGKQKRFSHMGATDLDELDDAKTTSKSFKNLYEDYIND